MKKAMKKLMAALMAVAMLCALAVPAFAAANANHTLTIKGKTTGHTYQAYQVFAGKQADDGVLSDIVFGTGVKGDELLTDPELPTKLAGKKNAAELAAELVNISNNSEQLNQFAKVISKHLDNVAGTSTASGTEYTIDNLPDGYYFIKDASDTLPNGATYSRYMLNILTNATINTKDTSVTLVKQIQHNETEDWGTVGDNQIGDTVNFRTISTVPDTNGYSDYTYEIHDEMDSQITSNVKSKADVTIKIGSTETSELDKQYYEVTATGNSFVIEVYVKAAQTAGILNAGDELHTYFSGVLNETAKESTDGHQENKAWLSYSNNPNDNNSKGKTPDSVVHDWTFKINITKIDGANKNKTLSGAKFVLSKNGNLKISDLLDDNGNLTKTTDLIKLVDNTNGSYTIANETQTNNYTMVTPTNGQISIKGLDDKITYYLYEIEAPVGYNTLADPVAVVVVERKDKDYTNEGHAITEVKTTVNGRDSSASFEIENNAGTTLPSTGGIGTTIFYVVGGGLMIAAAVLLITKKRMEGKN